MIRYIQLGNYERPTDGPTNQSTDQQTNQPPIQQSDISFYMEVTLTVIMVLLSAFKLVIL